MTAATLHPPRLADIQAAVCRRFCCSAAELIGQRRNRAIARPRQVAMYLAQRLTHRSTAEIGRFFGGRDHSTVLHARDRVRELAAKDRDFAEAVSALEVLLSELAANRPCSCSDCRTGARSYPLDPPQLHLPIGYPDELALEARAA